MWRIAALPIGATTACTDDWSSTPASSALPGGLAILGFRHFSAASPLFQHVGVRCRPLPRMADRAVLIELRRLLAAIHAVDNPRSRHRTHHSRLNRRGVRSSGRPNPVLPLPPHTIGDRVGTVTRTMPIRPESDG